jgi:hypothetical protein
MMPTKNKEWDSGNYLEKLQQRKLSIFLGNRCSSQLGRQSNFDLRVYPFEPKKKKDAK